MKIYYQPPTYPLDSRGQEEFYRKYVVPLGRGRKNVKISTDNAIIEGNTPGLLGLSANLLAISLTDSIHSWRLEPMEQLSPPGGWYGDLELKSPYLSLERVGSASHSLSFSYENPPYRADYRPPMEANSIIELVTSHNEPQSEATIRGNSAGLISIAKHSIYLSQGPDGAKISFEGNGVLKRQGTRLTLEKAQFSEDISGGKKPI